MKTYHQGVTRQLSMEREMLRRLSSHKGQRARDLGQGRYHLSGNGETGSQAIPPRSARHEKRGHLVSSPLKNLHPCCFYIAFVGDSLHPSMPKPPASLHPSKDPGSFKQPQSPPGTQREEQKPQSCFGWDPMRQSPHIIGFHDSRLNSYKHLGGHTDFLQTHVIIKGRASVQGGEFWSTLGTRDPKFCRARLLTV